MSGYRQLHTHIWSDSWFAELEPDLKLLFIYLFSNERASVCGLYELSLRTISFETGLGKDVVKKGFEVFDKADKVKYDLEANVVWVKNMLKYQGSTSPKVQARVRADIKAVPDCAMKKLFLDTVSKLKDTLSIPGDTVSSPTDTLSIPYRRGSDTSSYSSSIDQFNLEGAQGEPNAAPGLPPEISRAPSHNEGGEEESPPLPRSPAEAMVHPDVRVYAAVTGGRIPGLSQYQTVIEAVRFLRVREKLGDAELRSYLAPYWLAWSSRKRLDGRPYDPGNITWLAEWALNGSIPPAGGLKAAEQARPAAPSVEETRRMLAEKDKLIKQATPMPESMRAKIRGLAGQLAGKDAHSAGTGAA